MAAQRTFPFVKVIVALAVGVIVGLGIYYLFDVVLKDNSAGQAQNTPLPQNADVLVSVAVWIPDAGWSVPSKTTESTAYGSLPGYKTVGTVTSDQAYLDPFEHKQELEGMGYVPDTGLDASGPGSNMWGYKRTVDGKEQILVLGYNTQPSSSNPNEPLQFNCPCQIEVSAFVSDPFTPTTQ